MLFLRQLYLHHRAALARGPKPTLSVLEQPEDPEEYVETDEARGQTYPSYWSWPEWKAFRDPWGVTEVSFDQGHMGHARRKPTRLGTNIAKLTELQDIRGPGVGGNTALAEDLTERIKQSKDWSTWAPGLKMALVTAIRETLKSSEFQVKRMDIDAWKRHLLNGHLPYSRECKSCVIAASRGRAHKRIPHAEAYTLSIDTAGPFMLADDQLGNVLVGVYLVPVTKGGQSIIPIHEEDELPGAEGDGPGLTVVDGERGGSDREEPWPGLDDEKEWASLVEPERDFQVKQVTLAEVMENRGASAVLEAVGRMVAKLNFLGLPLKRLHSDRAGEYQSKMFDKWIRDRGLCRTFTDGDNFKGNGRAEGAVAQLKRGARTLLVAAGLDEGYWCHATRHWADTRLRSQLESMGWKRRQLATFGQVVWAKRKLYSDRQKYLSTTRTQVRVLCPAVTMSMTSQGYFVEELATGKLFHTADIIQVEDMPEGVALPDREAGVIHEVDDREETQQPRKRPGRTRGKVKLLQLETEMETV